MEGKSQPTLAVIPGEDLITISDRDVAREAKWLREAGHTFVASMLEALWRQLGSIDVAQMTREIKAGRLMREAIRSYEDAENNGFTKAAVDAWNVKERAIEHYDATRAFSEKRPT